MAKKLINLLIVIVVVFTAGFFASRYWYGDTDLLSMFSKVASSFRKTTDTDVSESTSSENEMAIEEEKPETEDDIKTALKAGFAAKYDKSVTDVNLTISDTQEGYVKGLVKFAGEISGGWFLAAKEAGGGWILVADGNGTVMCEDVAPYSFPVVMVPECWDDASQSLVNR